MSHALLAPLLLLLAACDGGDKDTDPLDPGEGEGEGEGEDSADSGDSGGGDPCAGEGEDAAKRAVTCAMVDAASALLASLDAEQLAKIQFSMDDPERMEWDNRPIPSYPRAGLAFGELSEAQLPLAYALLEASLSAAGYQRAGDIILIDELARLEGDAQMGEEYYHVDIFGTPSMDAAWGWQLDGHHLAINWTVSGAELVMTPTFYGVRPTEVSEGEHAGLRALAELEDRAFALLESLSEEQRALAITADAAPADLEVGPHKDGLFPTESIGISGAELDLDQQGLLLDLVDAYVGGMPDAQGEERLGELAATLDETWFAWMGPTDGSGLWYYRIAGPTVWIELDVIGSPDHIHAIWRDPLDDYGEDLLAEHLARYDHGPSWRGAPLDIRALSGVERLLARPLDR